MRSASSRFELPENSISRFCGPRSIQRLGSPSGTGGSTVSSPGSVAVSVIGWPSVLVVDVAFLRHLARREARERAWRNVVRYDGTDRDPRVVADLDWCNERIVDAGPDVAADLRPPLGLTRLMRIVNGDPAGADVRLRADLGVADVGQVRHLCPFSDPRGVPNARTKQLEELLPRQQAGSIKHKNQQSEYPIALKLRTKEVANTN